MQTFVCQHCGGRIDYEPSRDIDRAITAHVYACAARLPFSEPPELSVDGLARLYVATLTAESPGIHLRCPDCPYHIGQTGFADGCAQCHLCQIDASGRLPITAGDELRAVIEAEFILSGHWQARHGCDCGRHI